MSDAARAIIEAVERRQGSSSRSNSGSGERASLSVTLLIREIDRGISEQAEALRMALEKDHARVCPRRPLTSIHGTVRTGAQDMPCEVCALLAAPEAEP